MKRLHKGFDITSYLPEGFEKSISNVIIEAPVDISINAKHWLTLMCTPSHLDELAIGFLYNEGIIKTIDEIRLAEVCHNGRNIDIWLNHNVDLPDMWQRTSGCMGGATSVKIKDVAKSKIIATILHPKKILWLTDLLLKSQSLYAMSGGVHSSALSDGENILVIMEDIGRHNTLDKIAGRCLMEIGFPTPGILITTGRISSEMLQKAAHIGASIIISRTAPSSLSIDYARYMGICLIGYARKDRFKIYSHAEYVEQSK
ncbi:MAG: formate dehydrogenase family accessory protein FdhD [Chloroflexi bacterium GWB2_49_20]|nr:MAG: formate dehydrogenase family accessory protein FdhD [Chloroflexi bacterium GWB2_49_20]OGN80059.1 MAG: formate dehydrogenase family accessory protein FdhD [Chloroflexi bacterium GWC2_49_37]OGN85405.1 MAG: formate dehydrogenase family accessory protein FdhD [Chloroflexi bacterium GWD2_49_16]HCM97124.1 formate dehydrogenase accessory sulfurtransferase FdhD [Anaerolineae bacterium]